MDRGDWGRAELKGRCLTRIVEAALPEAERVELVNCVETYVKLTPEEAEEFSLLDIPETRRTYPMLYRLSWKDEMILEGRTQGARELLVSLLEARFGLVPEAVRSRIESIDSFDRLDRLVRKAATAKTLKSLRLGG